MRTCLILWLLAVSLGQIIEKQEPKGKNNVSSDSPRATPSPVTAKPSGENTLGATTNEKTSRQEFEYSLKKGFAPDTWAAWALVIVGIWTAYVALNTLGAIKEHSKHFESLTRLMELQLSIAHRAYLVIGEPSLVEMEAKFPIENCGQIAGRIVSIDIEIIRRSTDGGQELYRRSIIQKTNEIIVHGKANSFSLVIYFPQVPEEGQDFLVGGTVEYETGFNGTDTLKFVRVYIGDNSRWVTGGKYIDIDFWKAEHGEKEGQEPN